MNDGFSFVDVAIGAVIAISVVGTIASAVVTLTGTGGALENDIAGDVLTFAPLVFVASILGFIYRKSR